MSRVACACGPCESLVERGGPTDPPELCPECRAAGCKIEGKHCLTPLALGDELDRLDEQGDIEDACRIAAALLESQFHDPRCGQVAECLRLLVGGES